ncbi:basic secretory protein-like protein [Pontibacter chitinilyticus]|uniref:basic secretory protein-like protein n=1 Tax=Pontibacter chitinilyticus TaxID=2674989 RepID=UPI00321904A7
MKTLLIGCLLILGLLTLAQAQGVKDGKGRQNDWSYIGNYLSRDSVTHGPYTLVFINKDTAFAQSGDAIKQAMEAAFFKVYPQEAERFNPKTATKVTFIIDPGYKGVAATSGDIIRFSPAWMLAHPEDIDVVTHEAFHIVQDYGDTPGPGWLTEGITDYVRYKYGVNNAKANWSLPDYKPEQSYTNSYRITARFLAWLEKHKDNQIADKLNVAMRNHTYTPQIWVSLTGKTLDELWQEYGRNPAL